MFALSLLTNNSYGLDIHISEAISTYLSFNVHQLSSYRLIVVYTSGVPWAGNMHWSFLVNKSHLCTPLDHIRHSPGQRIPGSKGISRPV